MNAGLILNGWMMVRPTQHIYGIHSVSRYLDRDADAVAQVWMLNRMRSPRARLLKEKIQSLGLAVQTVPRQTLDKLAHSRQHQGFLIETRMMSRDNLTDLSALIKQGINEATLILILDSVQDPHNLGACIRTAVAAGVNSIVVPKHNAAKMNDTVRKVASGAAEEINLITVVNFARGIRQLKDAGVWIVGLAGDAQQSLYQADLSGAIALVMGGEQRGLRPSIRKECDHLLSIPIADAIESLNVSVATGIALFEVVRQRPG